MLARIRAALADDGLTVLLATVAIGWGLSTLQKVAETKTARLAELGQAIADADQRRWHAEDEARAAAQELVTVLAKDYTGTMGVAEDRGGPSVNYTFAPSRDDLDPLGTGAPS